LEIFIISSDLVSTQTIGDRNSVPMTAERLQAVIVESRAQNAEADARAALERMGGR
jgi:septum formation topological specificity factor MinE